MTGGALYVNTGSVNITDCTFINNTLPVSSVSANGGAGIFYITSGTGLLISNCTFDGNSAFAGGALAFLLGRAQIIGSTFKNNVGMEGGSLYVLGMSSFLLSNSTFYNNTAYNNPNVSPGTGGAAVYTASSISIVGCNFMANSAVDCKGGALFSIGATTNVFNSSFVSNNASTGGAVAITASAALNIYNSSFQTNTANGGGAIYIPSTTKQITISNDIYLFIFNLLALILFTYDAG